MSLSTPGIAIALACVLAAGWAKGVETVHSIPDYGATPDGKTLCTEAIQKAIDAAADAAGGIVRVPKGTFLSGALRLRSGVTLQLDEGAALLGSRDHAHYYGPKLDDDGEPVAGTRVFRNLIHGDGLDATFARGAAPLIRMANVRKATLRRCSPKQAVDVLLRLEGKTTRGIVLERSDLSRVRRTAVFADGAGADALSAVDSERKP